MPRRLKAVRTARPELERAVFLAQRNSNLFALRAKRDTFLSLKWRRRAEHLQARIDALPKPAATVHDLMTNLRAQGCVRCGGSIGDTTAVQLLQGAGGTLPPRLAHNECPKVKGKLREISLREEE